MADLFDTVELPLPARAPLAPGAMLLRGFALPTQEDLLSAVAQVTEAASFRHLITPGGFRMSVAMTNCGNVGWVSDRTGYRYDTYDPESGRRWPAMPAEFARLAAQAADAVGYADFIPDACLINRYLPGARLTLHRDRDERDTRAPIVSVSLGLPATFVFGGLQRSDPVRKIALRHGDVVVWGGPSRLVYHGVLALPDGEHPKLGRMRINLTFRRAV